MFNSMNGNKSFSLANIIEEQLSNISLGGSQLNLETDNNVLTLEETQNYPSASNESPRRNSTFNGKEEIPLLLSQDVDKVVDILLPSEVRWFYKEMTSKTWIPFGGYDTLNIETAFRNLPIEIRHTFKKYSPKLENISAFAEDEAKGDASSTFPKILVMGGLYEVVLVQRSCSSIYWPGEEFVVTRGSWFYEASWQPLEEETAETMEDVHLSLFLGKKSSEFPLDSHTKALRTEVFNEFNVDWYSPNEVYVYSQATPSKIVRSFTQKLGYFQRSTGSRVLRGYKVSATDSDKQNDISHLVFVVHGIGQKMNIGAQIFRNTSSIRERVSYLKEKYFPESAGRVEFFPVEWRNNLILDGGMVDSITPPHVKMLRQVLNTSAMDIMYYTSPIYCGEIQAGLVTEMNRLYSMFCQRNPSIKPKVSVIAHSLGAVIVYDIVTGWLPMGTNNDGILVPGKSRLDFELDNFFCLGSPLSVFLALRVPKGQHGYHLFPPTLCNRLYNIFHLTDPVAYRLEPLIVKDYARIAPLSLHPYNAVRPIPYSEMPLELSDLEQSAYVAASSAGDPLSTTSPAETPSKERTWSIWNLVRVGKSQESGSPHHKDSPTQGLEHRLDYVLTSGAAGPLVVRSVLISHTAYWSNYDVAFFVLTRIFPELEIQAYLAGGLHSSSSLLPPNEEKKDEKPIIGKEEHEGKDGFKGVMCRRMANSGNRRRISQGEGTDNDRYTAIL
uniref:DDHD domain-containing protein n=1 Tax=Rhodnius prolixus TaxID=13249 RepID=T1HB26_RHOPR